MKKGKFFEKRWKILSWEKKERNDNPVSLYKQTSPNRMMLCSVVIFNVQSALRGIQFCAPKVSKKGIATCQQGPIGKIGLLLN